MATIQQHHIKALTPTWFLVKVTPPAPAPREGGSKKPAYSPLLLSPAVWQKAQDEKRSKDGAERGGGLPASPRISCMGQVKGRTGRGCSTARGPAPRGSGYRAVPGGKVATLVLGLFGRRNARTSRACPKVRDVPGSSRGGRRGPATTTAALVLDPPLPVVRRPATDDDNAPSLWERRRGGKALQGLQLS
ncbi:hypothetical protein PAHAL_9G124000 [Panicum hallii]|uniref:Uncharacterized protein n=1 Tax=Panicum hallii TaxID=206008 RepID=A0A2T8I0Y9_9POAL|nr:uncharacterized protein LOC112875717 [Panicum hallii]PVH31357.1 hypothetical protein PAHAL_9G124000 [Panicum hallii]